MKLLTVAILLAAPLLASGDFSNRRAPGFSLADSHYQQHDPQDYRGKILLIDVMATACPTCIQLADTLVRLKEQYGDKLAIISILTQPDNFQSGDRFAAQHKITWPVVYDSGQVLASYVKATPTTPQVRFPHLFVIDQNGWITNDYEGAEWEKVSAEIARMLSAASK